MIGVFRHPVEALLGLKKSRPALQEATTSWGAKVFRMPGPYAKAEETTEVLAELRYVSREIITEPVFTVSTYGPWTGFFEAVLAISTLTGEHPDHVVLKMYTDDVRRSLRELPTPPWYL